MGQMGFQKAVREKVWLKVLMSGASGSGKSYSALRVATGLAEQCGSRIAYIGTEGSRDKYYSNSFDYDLLSLEPPFSIDKYVQAIDLAIASGYKVVIIDSLTHEWKWLNDTHDKMPGNSWQNWSKLKPMHRAFMDKILQSPIHVIATARARTEWSIEEKNGKQSPKKLGLEQQQDKDISYEYTVSFMIDQETHVATADKDNTGYYDNVYDVLTENDGRKLYAWANDGEEVAPKPKAEAAFTSGIVDLEVVKSEILSIATKLIAVDKNGTLELIKKYVPNGNPKAISDINDAQKLLEELKVKENA